MKLFEMAKKFGDGFKEGWNGCQSDGKTEWQEEQHSDEPLLDEQNSEVGLFPDYDDIYDVAHPNFYPEHPIHK